MNDLFDPTATGASRVGMQVYSHAMRYAENVDAMIADGVCEGVAFLLADHGIHYNP